MYSFFSIVVTKSLRILLLPGNSRQDRRPRPLTIQSGSLNHYGTQEATAVLIRQLFEKISRVNSLRPTVIRVIA
jgi:hypothetical protein